MRTSQNNTEQKKIQNVLEQLGANSQQGSRLLLMKLAKGTTIWDPARILRSPGTTIKPLKIKQRIKLVTIKNSKTQLRYEMKLKFEMNK